MRRDFSLNQVIAVNKIYRVVWNAETGQWVVASEMAKGRKKKATAKGNLAALGCVALLGSIAGNASAASGTSGYLDLCAKDGSNKIVTADGSGGVGCQPGPNAHPYFSMGSGTDTTPGSANPRALVQGVDGVLTLEGTNGVNVFGHPMYREGIAGVHEWDYVFKFPLEVVAR